MSSFPSHCIRQALKHDEGERIIIFSPVSATRWSGRTSRAVFVATRWHLVNNFDKSYFQFLALTEDDEVTSGISTSWGDAKLKAIAEGYERQRSADVRHDVHTTASSSRVLGSTRAWLLHSPTSNTTSFPTCRNSMKIRKSNGLREWITREKRSSCLSISCFILSEVLVGSWSSTLVPRASRRIPTSRKQQTVEFSSSSSVIAWCEAGMKKKSTKAGLPDSANPSEKQGELLEESRTRRFRSRHQPEGCRGHSGGDNIRWVPLFRQWCFQHAWRVRGSGYQGLHEAESRLIYGLNEPETRTIEPTHVHTASSTTNCSTLSRRCTTSTCSSCSTESRRMFLQSQRPQ